MPDDSKPGSTIKSLVKTLRLLKLFSPQHNVWTAEDMVSTLGYHKSSVQRILATLEREGFLSKVTPRRTEYRLGPDILYLGNVAEMSTFTVTIEGEPSGTSGVDSTGGGGNDTEEPPPFTTGVDSGGSGDETSDTGSTDDGGGGCSCRTTGTPGGSMVLVGTATGFLIAALHHTGLGTLTHTPKPMNFLNTLCNRPDSERPLPAAGHWLPDCLRDRPGARDDQEAARGDRGVHLGAVP